MSTATFQIPATSRSWNLPERGRVAMCGLIIAESAIFTIFVVAYLFYLGKDLAGPTPSQVLEAPVFYTFCLLSSSVTIHIAELALARGRQAPFVILWLATCLLGALFLYGTGQEWRRLIDQHGLTISSNLFGTTYYSLVGLHAIHVSLGLLMLAVVLGFAVVRRVGRDEYTRIGVLSMYWHFVDAIWVIVFAVVYVIGR